VAGDEHALRLARRAGEAGDDRFVGGITGPFHPQHRSDDEVLGWVRLPAATAPNGAVDDRKVVSVAL
jgi:hypothetical protein